MTEMGFILLALAVCGAGLLGLMLYMQRKLSLDNVSESTVPHKLTEFEQSKAVDADNSILSVPCEPGGELPTMRAERHEDVIPTKW